jgi:BMFP domain-containing protein YqiC
MMVSAQVRKGISFVTDKHGEKLAIQFNLKNKVVRELMEDFFDTLDLVERENEPSRPFEEVHQEILEKHNKNAKIHH